MKDFYPDKGLDADAAQKLMDQFSARLKFYIAPDSPALKDDKNKRGRTITAMPADASAVTGVVVREGAEEVDHRQPRSSRPSSNFPNGCWQPTSPSSCPTRSR